LLLRISTGQATLAGSNLKIGTAQRKPPKGGTNGAHEPGRARRLARGVKNLPSAGDPVKRDRWTVRESNLRVQRRDPWPWPTHCQKRWPTRAQAVMTRMVHRRVFTWFASRWRNHQPKRAEKPHSIIRNRKNPDGPATRPITPLAVENGVGKPAASERSAPNVGAGKRVWRTPTPQFVPVRPPEPDHTHRPVQLQRPVGRNKT